jgi:kynurenine formamidase
MEYKLVDLSHIIENEMITYQGLPAPRISEFLSREASRQYYDPGTEFQIGRIEMVGNTGTYLDSPFHRFHQGKDLSQVELNRLIDLEGVSVKVPHQKSREIGIQHFTGLKLAGKAVLICTGWSEFWRKEQYHQDHPYLTEEAAEYLKKQQAVLVGIDSYNIDNTSGKARPVHSILLQADILVLEHMTNLSVLPAKNFIFSAIPPRIKGLGSFPVRAYAKIRL